MRIEEFNKLKSNLETFAFEKNFKKLATTLYWFSFLGNIFLVLFSFFFIKNVTNSIPKLFEGQEVFFAGFVMLFMVGYELFKRFSFEQLTLSILRTKEFTINIFLGVIVCLGLVSGSFYLSINGAHRLIDTSDKIELSTDNIITHKSDSIAQYYNKQIVLTQTQVHNIYTNNEDGILGKREKASLEKFEKDIKQYDSSRDAKIKELEIRYLKKNTKSLDKIDENNFAFILLVFFLEFIILIGVAFEAYYTWNSYDSMKQLLGTSKFKELEQNLRLLRAFYQNGTRKKDDETIDNDKLAAICSMQNIDLNKTEINTFLQLCFDLGIIHRRKDDSSVHYLLEYSEAKKLIEEQIYL